MDSQTVKKIVKDKYQKIAVGTTCGCSCGCQGRAVSRVIAKDVGYSEEELQAVGGANLGLGCGNPVAMGKLKPGDVVLDLGPGAGIDCILAAQRVGSTGSVIGVDMTEEMIAQAQRNVRQVGLNNVEFKLGDIENLPIEDNSIDVIISNCVVNLAPDKAKVFGEASRVLKSGGRIYLSDIVLLGELSEDQKTNEDLLSGCVAGALLKNDYLAKLNEAGFDVNILKENKEISKTQYQGINLESLTVEAIKK